MQTLDNKELLTSLSNKLQNANRTVILQKKKQRQEIEQRMEHIQAMLLTKKKFEADAIQKAKFSVDRISTMSHQTVKNFNIKSRKQSQLVHNMKEQVENQLECIQRSHDDKIEQIVEKQTQKMTQVIEELTKQSKSITQINEKSILQISKAISNLQKNLQDQSEQRKDNIKQIQSDISNQVEKFNLIVEKERQRRQFSQQKLQGMMEQIKNKVTLQIQNTTNKRKRNNAAILKLIEGACQKLEQKLQIKL